MLRAHDSELRKIILSLKTSETVDNPIDKFYDGFALWLIVDGLIDR